MFGLPALPVLDVPQSSNLQLVPVVLKKDTPVKLMLVRPLSSQTSGIDTVVDFALAEDLKDAANNVIVRAGTVVTGKVTDREKPNMLRWYGLLAIDAEAMCVKSGDAIVTIPMRIKPRPGSRVNEFKTRTSLAPPKATPAQLDKFKSTQQPFLNKVLDMTASSRQKNSGALTSGLTAGSAIILAQILDPKDADKYGSLLNSGSLISSVKSAKSMAQFSSLAKGVGGLSVLTVAGIGIGLWELYDLVSSFYRETTIANGTLFDCYIAKDSQISIAVPEEKRAFWHSKVHFKLPDKFAGVKNVECTMAPSPFEHSKVQKRAEEK